MDAWIRSLVLAATSGFKAVVDAAWERIAWIYTLIVSTGLAIKNGWAYMRGAIQFKLGQLISLAHEVYTTTWWIIWVRIPSMVNNGINIVTRWAVEYITYVRNEIRAFLDGLIFWVSNAINNIVDGIGRLNRWIADKVGKFEEFIFKAGALVFTLLTDPRRMARWLMGALATELMLWVDSNAEAILDWFRKRATGYALAIATRIEEVLTRML